MKTCLYCHHSFAGADWNCPACGYVPSMVDGFLCFAPQLAISSEGFDSSAFPILAKLEAQNFWFRARNRLIIYAIRRYFPQAQSLLEIGCGTGFVLQAIERQFPQMSCSGSEIFIQGLQFAKQRLSRTVLFQMDARQIPFSKEFDIIGAFDVLEHIEQDRDVLGQMYKATRSGGGIIITVPQHLWLWSQADTYAHHVRRYVKQNLISKVEESGYSVTRVTSFVFLLLPLMLISRLSKRSPSQKYDPVSELKISQPLNFTLEKILDLERWFIQLGVSFPFGGSLLVVAHKK